MNKFKEIRPIVLGIAIKDGKSAHELILFYTIDLEYQDEYILTEEDDTSIATWIDIEEFKYGNKILYLNEMFKYI